MSISDNRRRPPHFEGIYESGEGLVTNQVGIAADRKHIFKIADVGIMSDDTDV